MSDASWIIGKAVRGKGRGTKLGFPTANLELSNVKQRPAEGVYAARVKLADDKKPRLAAAHVGPVPTFNQKKPTVEVHILDFPYQELYGQELAVQFVEKVADIKKFDSIDDLKKRIQQNVDRVREVLTS